MLRSPREFFAPLAIGAPQPLREIPASATRMIHFLNAANARMVEKVPEMLQQTDVLLGNMEDAVAVSEKEAAREGFIRVVQQHDFGGVGCWARVNALDSPWFLDDVTRLAGEIGGRLDVMMVPKVLGPEDIHYVDRLLAQLEARHHLQRPILVHAILETAGGVARVEEIALASPRMQGMSLGPADLAASRRMKTTRVGGGHPLYRVRTDPDPAHPERERTTAQQDPWHYSIARMVDACVNAGIFPYYGPFGDIADPLGCEDQFRGAFLLGCVGAWSLHPSQLAIARRVFSPDPAEVQTAQRIMGAMPDGSGVVMLDGKMQDDATWKQAKVIVDLARQIAARDPELAAAYGMA